jgi:hypothetical protein
MPDLIQAVIGFRVKTEDKDEPTERARRAKAHFNDVLDKQRKRAWRRGNFR